MGRSHEGGDGAAHLADTMAFDDEPSDEANLENEMEDNQKKDQLDATIAFGTSHVSGFIILHSGTFKVDHLMSLIFCCDQTTRMNSNFRVEVMI